MQKSKRLQMAEGKYCLKQPITQEIHKSMQHRPELKIQSGLFNKSHLNMHTEVQVFLYPRHLDKSEKVTSFWSKSATISKRIIFFFCFPRISWYSILFPNYQHLGAYTEIVLVVFALFSQSQTEGLLDIRPIQVVKFLLFLQLGLLPIF